MTAISSLLSGVSIGEPRRHGRLEIFPLFAFSSDADAFILLDEALAAKSVEVTETSDSGSVPVLNFLSRSAVPVLLLDGEELVGAKQNRILNTSILAPAGAQILLPVSCVEQGRWRYSSHSFKTADHALFAKARARKASRMNAMHERRRAVGESGPRYVAEQFDADQHEVWSDVSDKLSRMRVESASSAISDGYESYGERLREFEAALAAVPGQRGAAFALDGRIVGIELLATETAFRAIFRKLIKSYAFDALEASEVAAPKVPTKADVEAFIARVLGATASSAPSAGLGSDVRLAGEGCAGHALVHDESVLHLAAFDEQLAI
ncbi:MAG TPA: hypothetical protein PLN33_20475 [Hyphomonadaceae bacterium]|nr:hypothetical protein [Hyphomonadaceae bacterium]